MMLSDIPLKLFFGLVAIAIVGRDQETGSIPAQDFRLRFRHREERLQADILDSLVKSLCRPN